MNPITQYKKAALGLIAIIAMGAHAVILAECKPCAAAAAIKQSLKDAHAAAIAGKPAKPNKPSREAQLDQLDIACCEYCAKYCRSNNARCEACQAGLVRVSLAQAAAAALEAATLLVHETELDQIPASNDEDQPRAPREALSDPCPFPVDEDLNAKLQALFNCCVNTNQHVQCQGRLSEKCCKKLRHRIHDVKELIEDQIEDSEACCTLLESLIVSQIDASAECCSVIESLIVSQIDQTAVCCSVTETGITSIIDQSAACCSVIESQITDLSASVAEVFILLLSVFDCTCGG